MPVRDCRVIDLPKIADPRGNLSFVEGKHHIPFDIRRVYYLYDVPPDAERGAHGHRALEQLIVPLAGSVEVEVDDGAERFVTRLARPDQGLYISPLIWRDLRRFSPGATVLVLASLPYDEDDYFRDYGRFLQAVRLREG